jgi:glycosyltransferase involved in cell wall biosynthesis
VKVAYYSPLPPDRSGIADYSAMLIPALRKRIRVGIARRIRRPHVRRAHVDLYHIGNHPESHDWIVRALRRRPGVVVLHEFVLHHLVAGMTLGRGDARGYVEAMRREGGAVGVMLAWGVVEGVVPPLWEAQPERFPLVHSVLDHATGVISHSRFVEERVREAGFTGPVWRVPSPAWETVPAVEGRELPPDRHPIVGSFGHLTASKRIAELLEAFVRLRQSFPSALLVLGGTASPRLALDERLEALRLDAGRDVVCAGYVAEPRLWRLVNECDICVGLRAPTMGETSAMALRILSAGKPLVVSDVGWFSELPGSVAARVPADENEVEILTRTFELLAGDPELRERMGELGREYVAREHSLDRTADAYTAALEEAAGGAQVREAVLGEVSRAAAEVGIQSRDPEVEQVARAAREVGLGH